MADFGHSLTVVMYLSKDLWGCDRRVVADNFLTSISLAKRLLRNDTSLIGTLRSNRAGSGHQVVQKKLKYGEVDGLQTRPSHSAIVVDTRKTNKLNERIMKPPIVIDYNEGKPGIDLSDQLSAYYTCLRRSLKWYHKVIFELIFETSLVNNYLIYKENYAASKVTILQFRESLVRSLLIGMPFEKLKPGPRQKSIGQTKRKLADHKLEEREAYGRDARRRFVGCYEKLRQQQSREASNAAAKKIKTFGSDWQFFCLDCFNEKHHAKQ